MGKLTKQFTGLLLLLLCLSGIAKSQNDSILNTTLYKTFPGSIENFTTDNFGNIYVLNSSGQIKKLDSKGDSIAVFNDVRKYGKVYSIDATNPLKILVYYKDFSTIIVLDRLLNIRNEIDLGKHQIFQVRAITSSYDNNIWLFDELDSKIKKIDENGNVLLQTTDFRQLYDSVPSPDAIYDRDGQLYIYDHNKGLLVYDYYGAQKNNIALKGIADLQVIDKNTITGRRSNYIILYKPATLQLYSFKIAAAISTFRKLRFDGRNIYGLTTSGNLQIFQTY